METWGNGKSFQQRRRWREREQRWKSVNEQLSVCWSALSGQQQQKQQQQHQQQQQRRRWREREQRWENCKWCKQQLSVCRSALSGDASLSFSFLNFEHSTSLFAHNIVFLFALQDKMWYSMRTRKKSDTVSCLWFTKQTCGKLILL